MFSQEIAPWPSGKAADSDSAIVSSNLTGAANMKLTVEKSTVLIY